MNRISGLNTNFAAFARAPAICKSRAWMVVYPRVIKEVKPDYTPAAMQQKIQGSVWLQIVVTEKGDVGEIGRAHV